MNYQDLIAIATEFQVSNNLDLNTTKEAFVHDAIHAITGLSASLADEEIVLNLTNLLTGEETNPAHAERLELLVELVTLSGYFEVLVEALNN